MTLTAAGLSCDVCGDYILPICECSGDSHSCYDSFDCKGIDSILHCHARRCKQTIIDAGSDWRKLPDGPLRQAFEAGKREGDV